MLPWIKKEVSEQTQHVRYANAEIGEREDQDGPHQECWLENEAKNRDFLGTPVSEMISTQCRDETHICAEILQLEEIGVHVLPYLWMASGDNPEVDMGGRL